MATQIAYARGAAALDCHERGPRGLNVVQKVQERGPEEGFIARTEKFENLVHTGVIDPTNVVRSAPQHAAPIASLLLTMEAVITQIPERIWTPQYRAWAQECTEKARCH